MKFKELYKKNKRLTKAAIIVSVFGWSLTYLFTLVVTIDILRKPLVLNDYLLAFPISILLSIIHVSYIYVDLNKTIKRQENDENVTKSES